MSCYIALSHHYEQASLMFVQRVEGVHLKDTLLIYVIVLVANIGLSRRFMSVTNTLAYFANISLTVTQRLVTVVPGSSSCPHTSLKPEHVLGQFGIFCQ